MKKNILFLSIALITIPLLPMEEPLSQSFLEPQGVTSTGNFVENLTPQAKCASQEKEPLQEQPAVQIDTATLEAPTNTSNEIAPQNNQPALSSELSDSQLTTILAQLPEDRVIKVIDGLLEKNNLPSKLSKSKRNPQPLPQQIEQAEKSISQANSKELQQANEPKKSNSIGLMAQLPVAVSNYRKRILYFFKNNSFDPHNTQYMSELSAAINEANDCEDTQFFAQLVPYLQQEKYEDAIQLDDTESKIIAKKFINLYNRKQSETLQKLNEENAQLILAFKTKTKKFQDEIATLVETYQNKIIAMSALYKNVAQEEEKTLSQLRASIAKLPSINSSIQPRITNFNWSSSFIAPENMIGSVQGDANEQLASIIDITKNIPNFEIEQSLTLTDK